MTARPGRVCWLFIALAFAISLAAGCERPGGVSALRADTAGASPAATHVIAVKPARATLRLTAEQPGQIQAYETTAMHAKIAGYMKNITADIGTRLEQGQLMAELWVPEVVAERDQKQASVRQAITGRQQAESFVKVAAAAIASAEAKLAEMQAGIHRAEAELARWESEAKRVEQLVRDKVITPSLADETRSKLHAAQATLDEEHAQLKSAQAAVLQARAEREKALADLAAAASRVDVAEHEVARVDAELTYARIEAPYACVVTERRFDTGHLTQPGAASEPLFVVARWDLATIVVDVPEMSAIAVAPGDRALIRVQAIGGRTFEGKVTRSSWALDPKTRTLRTEIDLPNPEGLLRPGLYAYATIIAEEHPGVLALPNSALFQKDGKTYCVAVIGGKAQRTLLETGLNNGTLTEIHSGLQGNEVVVKAYAENLADGQPLEVTTVEEIPAQPGKP
jgi:HlyD family secretion protein